MTISSLILTFHGLKTMASVKALLDEDGIGWNEKVFKSSEGIARLGSNPFVSSYKLMFGKVCFLLFLLTT